MHIIMGILIMGFGSLFLVKTEFFLKNFGRIGFFERYLGSDGGSRLGYKLIGLIMIFIGVLTITNMIGEFVMWILSPLIKYNQPL